jgi:hypothetical protein
MEAAEGITVTSIHSFSFDPLPDHSVAEEESRDGLADTHSSRELRREYRKVIEMDAPVFVLRCA